jgi:MarR family transcriptional regulator, lower aerobic nicotinate degradation pathway regulator
LTSYKHISELIAYFETFENECKSSDLQEFACWLAQKTSESSQVTSYKLEENVGKSNFVLSAHQMEGHIGAMMGRMTRFAKFYAKKAFEELPVQTIEEFGCLAGIKELGNPSKSELVAMMLTEMTTGVEMIRRLVNGGLVKETPDPNDKRAKRLELTEEGEKILMQSFMAMEKVGRAGFSFLTLTEKMQLFTILSKLNRVHVETYLTHKEGSLEEIIENLEK